MTQEALLDLKYIRGLFEKDFYRPLTDEDREIIAYYWKKFMKTYKLLDWKLYDFFWGNFEPEYDDGRDYNDQCREFLTCVGLNTINNYSGEIDTMEQIYFNIASIFNEMYYWYYCEEIEDFKRFILSEIDKKTVEFENILSEYNS